MTIRGFAPFLVAAFVARIDVAHAGAATDIAHVVQRAAQAMSDLPKTRDRNAVLAHYAPDYTGITDGEWQTREGIEAVVAEIDENVQAGNPVKITNRASEIEAHPAEPYGWATWLSYSRIEVLGEVLGEVERRCSGIFQREGAAWRIRHEHCSAPWNATAPAGEDEEAPPRGDSEDFIPEQGPVEG